MELLFHWKGGSASFDGKMALSLNGVDPSCMNSITGSTCRAKYSNILHDRMIKKVYNIGLKYKYITPKITKPIKNRLSGVLVF